MPDITAEQGQNKAAAGFGQAGEKMKKQILLTDDNTEMREEVSGILEGEGYEVLTAEDGQEAIDLLGNRFFDLLILDLKMPVKSGYEVLRHMDEALIRVKTIVLTGNVLVDRYNKAGNALYDEQMRVLQFADTIMNKPFEIRRLLERIKHYTS